MNHLWAVDPVDFFHERSYKYSYMNFIFDFDDGNQYVMKIVHRELAVGASQ